MERNEAQKPEKIKLGLEIFQKTLIILVTISTWEMGLLPGCSCVGTVYLPIALRPGEVPSLGNRNMES